MLLFFVVVVLAITLPWYYASPKVDDKVIHLGMSGPFSGGLNSVGMQFLMGANVYFKTINEHGGIYGRTLKIIHKDDRYEPKIAVENVEWLLEKEKVFALFGIIGSATAEAVFPLAVHAKIPFIGAYTGAEFLRSPPNALVLNARASDKDEIEKMVHHYADGLGFKKIAFFYQSDAYGRAGVMEAKIALGKRGLTLCAEGSYKRNTLSIGNALYEIEQCDPDVILMMGSTAPVAEFIKRARKSIRLRDELRFGIFSFVEPTKLMDLLHKEGENITFAQVVPSPWTSEVEQVEQYRQLMKKYHPNEALSYVSLEGFFAARMIAEVLKEVGPSFTKKEFINALADFSKMIDEAIPSKNRDERCKCLHRVHLAEYVAGDFFAVGASND